MTWLNQIRFRYFFYRRKVVKTVSSSSKLCIFGWPMPNLGPVKCFSVFLNISTEKVWSVDVNTPANERYWRYRFRKKNSLGSCRWIMCLGPSPLVFFAYKSNQFHSIFLNFFWFASAGQLAIRLILVVRVSLMFFRRQFNLTKRVGASFGQYHPSPLYIGAESFSLATQGTKNVLHRTAAASVHNYKNTTVR